VPARSHDLIQLVTRHATHAPVDERGDARLEIELVTRALAPQALPVRAERREPVAHLAHERRMRAQYVVGPRRIAALVPEENTRLGAAVRHATAVLRAQPAQRRVLLLLSDGQPNDVDFYQGAYAIEDSRRALNDARAEGVVPFCLTVEQDEHEYLPHVFGKTGYRVLRRPDQLPSALLDVVKGILSSA
jgi:hypothetical protein